jgi:DNA-binding PadR family transcriptional regulator
MSLKHALLGFINYGPMTGYELKKFFDTSVAHFWNAELSQIYPALKAMESEGLVEMKVEVQEDRPNRKVYSITDAGRQALLKWLAEPAEMEQVREPILIKVFFGSALKKEQLVSVLRNSIHDSERVAAYLQQARAFVDRFVGSIGLQQEGDFWSLTIEAGLKIHRAEVEWAEEAIRKIESMDDSAFECRDDHPDIEMRTVTEVLDRIKSVMPGALASAESYHRTRPVDEGEKTREGAVR